MQPCNFGHARGNSGKTAFVINSDGLVFVVACTQHDDAGDILHYGLDTSLI